MSARGMEALDGSQRLETWLIRAHRGLGGYVEGHEGAPIVGALFCNDGSYLRGYPINMSTHPPLGEVVKETN